jgi:hypothetical protein
MKAFRYIEDLVPGLPFKVGKEIDFGSQGQIFNLIDYPDKIVKFSILYDRDPHRSIEDCFDTIWDIYQWIINNPQDCLVRIYDFAAMKFATRETVSDKQKYIVYYSIQEKLSQLSADEKKVFKTVCDAYNRVLEFDRPITKVVSELSTWFSFDKNKVLNFYNSILDCPIDNYDFEARNILKDNSGNFKLIDFDLADFKQMENRLCHNQK